MSLFLSASGLADHTFTSGGVALLMVRGAVYAALLWATVLIYRWMHARSTTLAAIFFVSVVTRVVLGSALFVVSYYQLPFFRSLQLDGGFWLLALDGRYYYDAAATAASTGLSTVASGSASPLYVRMLALWMRAVGVSPLSGALLNLACHIGVAALVVKIASSVRAAALALVILAASPALLIFGTQPLKDMLCVLFIATALAGVWNWCEALHQQGLKWTRLLLGAGLLAVAVYGVAGIRSYLAFFVVASVVAMGGWTVLQVRRHREGWTHVMAYGVLVPALWLVFMVGAGPYFQLYSSVVGSLFARPTASVEALDAARAGFVNAGGATSIESSVSGAALSPPPAAPADGLGTGTLTIYQPHPGFSARIRRLAVGSSMIVVPVTLLRHLSLVTFTGGKGLLIVTDVDTVLMDLAIIASFAMLITSRPREGSIPVILFAVVFATVTALAMAYVVTNFGTLFRLRLLAATPLWLIPVFVASKSDAPTQESLPS